MKFTEEKLEEAFIELLGQEGFSHHLGNTIVRAVDEVLCLIGKKQDYSWYLFK